MALASGHWLEKEMRGEAPSPRHGHALAVAGNVAFLFGGASSINPEEDNPVYFNDFYMLTGKLYLFGGVSRHDATECLPGVYSFDIVSLTWECLTTGGVTLKTLGHSSVAVGDNIYVYGGMLEGNPTDDLMVFNTAKMKWKVPLYVGIPPARRHGHTAFILHSHLYVFGGKNEEQEFNDLKVMKLINPSERQPVMKEILTEFGLQGVSHSFTPTKVPNVRYELGESSPSNQSRNPAANAQVSVHRDFSAVRDQAMKMIQTAFTLLDQEFQKLDREKSELSKAAAALQREKEAHDAHRQQQQQEEVLQEQERLKEEQSSIQKRSEHLLSIMQQFKGM
eukprot:superscaffoldBa00000739_g6915